MSRSLEKTYTFVNVVDEYAKENNLQLDLHTKKLLRSIIRRCCELFLNEMLLNKYNLLIGYCGYIRIMRFSRTNKVAVNWGESNKRAKEILEKGGKLAKKIGVDENNEPIFDDGEKWMVFFTDDDYLCLRKTVTEVTLSDKKEVHYASRFWKFYQNRDVSFKIPKLVKEGLINKNDYKIDARNQNNFI